jgi:hypothetical protein
MLVFNAMPGMCLILDAAFNILAQNDDHAIATLSISKNVVERSLFDAFPDNPYDSNASGVASVRQSLLNVLKTRKTDVMPIIRYDVQPKLGCFEVRYWGITNTPILGEDGFVRWFINRAEDATELAILRQQQRGTWFYFLAGLPKRPAPEPSSRRRKPSIARFLFQTLSTTMKSRKSGSDRSAHASFVAERLHQPR